MGVKVRMLGVLKRISGKDEISLDLSGGANLREVIERILEDIIGLKDILLDPELKDPRPNTIILVNGKEIGLLDGLETQIKDGDEIVLIPVVHGG
ncbi:MAG: MoaD family protein [Candidatus Bathyarchaeota archaeon]|nr:MoaD family protein [Candidatus Bathyarchaeota archaeon]